MQIMWRLAPYVTKLVSFAIPNFSHIDMNLSFCKLTWLTTRRPPMICFFAIFFGSRTKSDDPAMVLISNFLWKKGIQFGMPCIVICLLYGCSLALTPKPKITSAKRTSTPCSRTLHGFSNVLPQLKHIVGIPTFFEATFSPQFFALGNALFGKKILIFNVIWFLACQVRVSVDLARSIQHCELAILCQAKHRHQIKCHMTC